MARWTKKLLKEQMTWTNGCFLQALREVYAPYLTRREKRLDLNGLTALIRFDWREEIHTPETNAAYLKNLCKLSDRKLNLILEANQKGKQRRNQTTIDAIMTELFERSVPETRKR